jgi:hypothetical protein
LKAFFFIHLSEGMYSVLNCRNIAKHSEFYLRYLWLTIPHKKKSIAIGSVERGGHHRPLPISCVWTCLNSSSFQDDQGGRIHFQQIGAPADYLGKVREYLDTRFAVRWIGRAARIAWPPLSSDLTPLVFF